MFGIGFTEFLLIFVIAILFLGPEKLPSALMDMARFIKSVKRTISETKQTFNQEMKMSELKEEALEYKRELDSATDELRNFKHIHLDDIAESSPTLQPSSKEEITTQVEQKNETITFIKPTKKKDEDNV